MIPPKPDKFESELNRRGATTREFPKGNSKRDRFDDHESEIVGRRRDAAGRASMRIGPPILSRQWFVRIDAWAEWRARPDDNETLRRAGHCNRSAMRLLGRARCRTRAAYPYLPLFPREIRERKEGRLERAREQQLLLSEQRELATEKDRAIAPICKSEEKEREKDRETW